ncbi:MAG: hypothetical protein AAF267_07990 [Deinococcota bacterium]
MVFPGWTAWHWVAFAWVQLIGAYVGYIAYLQWRLRKLEKQQHTLTELDHTSFGDTRG